MWGAAKLKILFMIRFFHTPSSPLYVQHYVFEVGCLYCPAYILGVFGFNKAAEALALLSQTDNKFLSKLRWLGIKIYQPVARLKVFDIVVGDDFAVFDVYNPVGAPLKGPKLYASRKYCLPSAARLRKISKILVPRHGVQPACGLVQNKKLSAVGQG